MSTYTLASTPCCIGGTGMLLFAVEGGCDLLMLARSESCYSGKEAGGGETCEVRLTSVYAVC